MWFKSADPDSLASALRRLSDDAEAGRMTRAAYERYWAEPLTLDWHLDAIEEVYRVALAERPKRVA